MRKCTGQTSQKTYNNNSLPLFLQSGLFSKIGGVTNADQTLPIADCTETLALFTNTVRKVNAADYTPVQIDAWLQARVTTNALGRKLVTAYNGSHQRQPIVGFGDIDDTGYLDRLFVHHQFGRRGIATALVNELEPYARNHTAFCR